MTSPAPRDGRDGASRDEALAEQRRRQVAAAVRTWSGQLIDLGGRNQLLFYRDLKVGTLDLGDADPAAVASLMDGRTIALSRLFAQEVLPDRLKRARAIRNKAREGLEERGIATCFLATGMATWTNTTGESTPAAPLLLQEVSIAATNAAEDDFALSLTGELEANPTLKHLLATQFSVTLPADLADLIPVGTLDPQPVFDRVTKECEGIPGFVVRPRQVVGTFSYAKLPMVTDIEANVDVLAAHDVVAALAGHRPAQVALSAAGKAVDPADPDRRPPADEYLVLDADSSQSYAINAAVAGQSLVVSGPPGTGKSQTIANLIATLVARGQSVLFVAEKRAAITAVLDRLARVGLSDVMLDLHAGTGSRRAFAESLASGLRAAATIPQPDQRELHNRLVAERTRLNAHDAALNAPRTPWGVSIFDAQAALLGLTAEHGPAADTQVRLAAQALDGITEEVIGPLEADLHEFAALGGLTLTGADSPWADAVITSPEQADAALRAAQRLDTYTVPDTARELNEVLRQTGLRSPTTLAEWRSALDILHGIAGVLSQFRSDVFGGPLAEWVAASAPRAWRKANAAWPGARTGWRVRRQLLKQAKALWAGVDKPSRSQLHGALLAAHQAARTWAQHASDDGPPRLPASLAEVFGHYDQLTRELAALGAFLPGRDFTVVPRQQLASALHALAADERTVRKLPRLHELGARFRRAGLDPLIAELRARRPDPQLTVAILRNCWYQSILSQVSIDDPALAAFSPQLLDSCAADFRANDRAHIDQAAVRVKRAAAERLIATLNAHDDQRTLVQAQAARKRGHLPLRQLFSAAPDVMTALKPCWAMSPLVVAQLLPGDRQYFDVVVFDEASQIVPADAIPAITRARRVIVAGDRHQLPPTNFFAAASDGEDGGDAVNADGSINLALTSGFESILDVLTAALGDGRNRSLTWHYRSRDERLIAFSNTWIYDNSLTTFPGVTGRDCLTHVLVDQPPGASGQEYSVTAEVDRVVDLVLNHVQDRPHESLGVITMGIKHADRIETRLRERLRERRDLLSHFDESRDEKFFVKNLERVQGDERDAIILSIGYGKSPDGRLPYRFGPLLQDGGHRRLNVAVTRARSRVTLVSSFSHHDMDPNRSAAAGVQMLRAYLQYANSGGTSLGETAAVRPTLNPFEISVRDRLKAADIPITPQYGVAGYWIDFAANYPDQPGRMVLAIEADGASYHSSTTARDRDRLRQEQLERLGWTFHRIWSTDWFADADACVARVRSAYDRAVADADAVRDHELLRLPVQGAAHPALATVMSKDAQPTRTPPTCPIPASLPITAYRDDELIRVIRWIESDTLLRTDDELLDEFIQALGFQKRGSRIVAAFNRALAERRRTAG